MSSALLLYWFILQTDIFLEFTCSQASLLLWPPMKVRNTQTILALSSCLLAIYSYVSFRLNWILIWKIQHCINHYRTKPFNCHRKNYYYPPFHTIICYLLERQVIMIQQGGENSINIEHMEWKKYLFRWLVGNMWLFTEVNCPLHDIVNISYCQTTPCLEFIFYYLWKEPKELN